MIKDGIILAGGYGTRLAPINKILSKNLINVNGKVIIDFSIEALKKNGIENIIIVLGPHHAGQIIDYIQDGQQYNINVNFIVQKEPKGISHAISLCERFVKNDFIVMLGDNLYSDDIVWKYSDGAEIIIMDHLEKMRFGIATIINNEITNIVEKPKTLDNNLKNYAITGCYKFTQDYFSFFKKTKMSERSEFEIVDILQLYLKEKKLNYQIYNGNWWDIGTHSAIAEVNNYFYNLNKNNIKE